MCVCVGWVGGGLVCVCWVGGGGLGRVGGGGKGGRRRAAARWLAGAQLSHVPQALACHPVFALGSRQHAPTNRHP